MFCFFILHPVLAPCSTWPPLHWRLGTFVNPPGAVTVFKRGEWTPNKVNIMKNTIIRKIWRTYINQPIKKKQTTTNKSPQVSVIPTKSNSTTIRCCFPGRLGDNITGVTKVLTSVHTTLGQELVNEAQANVVTHLFQPEILLMENRKTYGRTS